jgi:hypothetical protein
MLVGLPGGAGRVGVGAKDATIARLLAADGPALGTRVDLHSGIDRHFDFLGKTT